jgi:hypothetical protein
MHKPGRPLQTIIAEKGYSVESKPNTQAYSAVYIIKIKGKAKIPDYIQLRDDSFVLVAYFRADRELKNLEKYGLAGKEESLARLISEIPFGKLQKLEL